MMVVVSHLHGLRYVRRSKQALKITHMKSQNAVGASIVQSFMLKNHSFLSATQTNVFDKAFSAKRCNVLHQYAHGHSEPNTDLILV